MKHLLILTLLCTAAPMAQACDVHQHIIQNQLQDLQLDISQGCDLNVIDSVSGNTPLMTAVQKNNLEAAKLLTQDLRKIDLEKTDQAGITALNWTAIQNRVEILQLLIDLGANIHTSSKDHCTPVFYSVLYNNKEVLALLIRYHGDLNQIGMFGHTPLTYAIAMGSRAEVFQMLIDGGADLHAKNAAGQTPLIAAVDYYDSKKAKILIEKKAGLNDQDQAGHTPLMKAIYNSDEEMATILIENKADLEVKNSTGQTALVYATSMSMGETEIAELLIEAGANVNAEDISGNTSLMNTTSDQSVSTIVKLIAKGADLNHQNHEGVNAIMKAAEIGDEDIILYFLDNHARVNERTKHGLTALMLADRTNCNECVLALLHEGALPYLNLIDDFYWDIDMNGIGRLNAFLNYLSRKQENHLILAVKNGFFVPASKMIDLPGMNLNQQDEDGTTALMLMVKARQKNLVEAMLLQHADRSLRDHQGMTALGYAEALGFTEIAELLK